MTFQLSGFSRSIIIAAAVTGMASMAIGLYAGLNNRSLNAAQATEVPAQNSTRSTARVALVIGNGHYPDAQAPLTQPINDAQAIGAALRREEFDVDVLENASR